MKPMKEAPMNTAKRPTAESLAEIPELDVSKARVVGRGLGTHRRFELRTLRAALGKTQAEIARAAEMDQGDVSRLERREDAKLSTLGRYARALGGRLQVAVVVGGHQYLLDVGEATHGAGAPARAGSSTKTTGAVALTGVERSRRPSSRGSAHRKRGVRSA
jgi:transcriptional regulator with XRE-family HTH domain